MDLKGLPTLGEEDIFYNGYFVNKTHDDLQSWIGKQFSLSSDIKSLKRKKTIQAILEKFSKYFESLQYQEGSNSFQFFAGENYSQFVPLTKSQMELIKKYHNKDIFLMEELYDWDDFYFNDKFHSAYEVEKELFQHYYFTRTKFEERDRLKPDYIKEYLLKFPADFFVANAKSKVLEKFSPQLEISGSGSKHQQFLVALDELELERKLKRLDIQLSEIERTPDKYLFGNEVIKGIENYEVKEVYCFEEFRKKLESKLAKELFNFQWVILPRKMENESIKKLMQYRGIFALKYY